MNLPAFARIASAFLLAAATSFAAETNEWIKPIDGKWEEPFWSLGRLPDSSQSILINSATEKTITLDATTTQQFPNSMTVNQLVVTGKTTIVLDHLPPANPLRVEPGTNRFYTLQIERESALVNLQSTLIIGNESAGELRLHAARISQDGGLIKTRSALMLAGAEYNLTNGIFEAEFFTFGVGAFLFDSFFNQYGGTVKVGTFNHDAEFYRLFDGELLVRTNTSLKGGGFVQSGGTHRVPSLSIFQSYNGGGAGFYSLEGGTLAVNDAGLGAFMSGSTFQQTGGTFEITNTLSLSGSSRYHPPHQIPATYDLTNGTMRARIVELNSRYGQAEFLQHGGTVAISEQLRLNVPESDTRSYLSLAGGLLQIASVSSVAAGADIRQTGGDLIVTNGFSFRGFIPPPFWAPGDRRIPYYNFLGGTLASTDIEIAGKFIIGSSTARNRISNLGTFKLAGTLEAGDCREELGPFILATNSLIDLGPGKAEIAFANSAAQSWEPASVLTITNWSGSLNGRGDDQLSFGADASGLTTQQLGMIRFVNPAGHPPGDYPATILATGEIIPHTPPAIDVLPAGNKLTLQWDESFRLQTATNVTGPYQDLPAAKSPYSVDLTETTQRYFRLK